MICFFDDSRFGEDVLTHVKSIISANKIAFANKEIYNYRSGRINSLMYNSTNINNCNAIIRFLNGVYYFLLLRNLYKELEEEYCNFFTSQTRYYLICRRECKIVCVNRHPGILGDRVRLGASNLAMSLDLHFFT